MRRLLALPLAAALIAAAPTQVLAWGASGHRMIGQLAMGALPAEVPAFLRTPGAADDAGELSREPDRSKAAGKVHDSDRDPAHFLDLADDGTVLGGPRLDALPPTRADYETALRAAGVDSWKAGYLPYAIVDRWQQLAHDFAYWRVLTAAQKNRAWAGHRAWYAADRRRREAQILQDIGELSHFVGDGAQPLHVTLHYNGWGTSRTRPATPRPRCAWVPSKASWCARRCARPRSPGGWRRCGSAAARSSGAPPNTWPGPTAASFPSTRWRRPAACSRATRAAPAFARDQLARGASELRDQIVEAWTASAGLAVGWKPVSPADVAAGRVDPYPSLYGAD